MTVRTHRSHGGIIEPRTERAGARGPRGEFWQMRAHVAAVRNCLAGAGAARKRETFRANVHCEIKAVEMLKPLPVLCRIGHKIADLTSLLGDHVVETADHVAASAGQTRIERRFHIERREV